MAFNQSYNQNNMTGATNGLGTAYSLTVLGFTPGYMWGVCFVDQYLSFFIP